MFSLLHGTICSHLGQLAVFPSNVEDSKDFLSPKAIGEGNLAEQRVQITNVWAILTPPFNCNIYRILSIYRFRRGGFGHGQPSILSYTPTFQYL